MATKKNEPDAPLAPEVIVTPDPKALADAGIQPVTMVSVTPKAPAASEPEPVDPDLKTPENQINVPPPPPEDPKAYSGPDSAVPVGEEWKTPAAQEHAARAKMEGVSLRKYVTGEDPNEPDSGKSKDKNKK